MGWGSPKGGSDYWLGNGFVKGAVDFFHNDGKSLYYTDVNFDALSSASERQGEGYEYAKENFKEITKGVNRNKDSFIFISHSMGGAFVAGMKEYLEEKKFKTSDMVFLNTFQANDIIITDVSNSINIIDYQNPNDPVLLASDFSRGDIMNWDTKIRENSANTLQTRHRTPIDNGLFFTNLRENQRFLNIMRNMFRFLIPK